MEKDLISISETAKILGVSIATLRRWDKSKQFPAVKTPGGHRLYDRFQVAVFVSDITAVGEVWVRDGGHLTPEWYCPNSGVFQARLTQLEEDVRHADTTQGSSSFISAIVGEIGDNSFAHNVANWPDVPGIFFANDVAHRRIVLADRGSGIWKTLRRVRPDLTHNIDALRVAFTEIVSGRAPEARGNGLKFVREAVISNAFSLFFQSGNTLATVNRDGLVLRDTTSTIRGCFAIFEY